MNETKERLTLLSHDALVEQYLKMQEIYERRINQLKQALSLTGSLSDDARRKELMTQLILRDMNWAEALHRASGGQIVVELGKGLNDTRSLMGAAKKFLDDFSDVRQLPSGEEASK